MFRIFLMMSVPLCGGAPIFAGTAEEPVRIDVIRDAERRESRYFQGGSELREKLPIVRWPPHDPLRDHPDDGNFVYLRDRNRDWRGEAFYRFAGRHAETGKNTGRKDDAEDSQ